MTSNAIALVNPGDKEMVPTLFSTINLVILYVLIRKSILSCQLKMEEVDGRSILADGYIGTAYLWTVEPQFRLFLMTISLITSPN